MEMLSPTEVINPKYIEPQIQSFVENVRTQLVAAMEDKTYSQKKPGIILNPNQVQCNGYTTTQMNTVRQVLTILTISVSDYSPSELRNRGVIEMPEEAPIMKKVATVDGGDLFNTFALNSKQYYLFLAYHMLTYKLSQRDTHLFRLLYILTCLELWREKIPGELVVGPAGKDVHWGDVIWQLTNRVSRAFKRDFLENGYPIFALMLSHWIEDISSKEATNNKIRNERQRGVMNNKIKHGESFPNEYFHVLIGGSRTVQ